MVNLASSNTKKIVPTDKLTDIHSLTWMRISSVEAIYEYLMRESTGDIPYDGFFVSSILI